MSENNTFGNKIRSVTSLSLDWIANKLRKSQQIQEMIKAGKYKVDNDLVARSIINSTSESQQNKH